MDEKKLKGFLLWDFLADPILIVSWYLFERFNETMWNTEKSILVIIFVCSFIVRIILWVGRLMWRDELDK